MLCIVLRQGAFFSFMSHTAHQWKSNQSNWKWAENFWDANCDFVVNKPTGCDIVLSTMEPFKFPLCKSTLYRITFEKNLRVEIFP